jgi:hypothetical protein
MGPAGFKSYIRQGPVAKVPLARAGYRERPKFGRNSQGSLPKIAFLAYLNEKTMEL